jgi:glycosyltransferase involved in cell wall biosynthesis
MRIHHLLRHLSRRHEVRQFSQPTLGQLRRRPFPRELEVTGSYREHRYTNSVAALAVEACDRTWVSAPVLSGAALSLTRPRILREWLRWADVVIVEFPWQFGFCRARLPGGRFVLATHNSEVTTRASMAAAAGVAPERSAWLRLVERLERRAVERADLVLAVSADERDAFIKGYGVDENRVLVIENGSDTDTFRPVHPDERPAMRRLLGLPERPTVVFVAGQRKSPDLVALDWVKKVAARLPDVGFLVIGGIAKRPWRSENVFATGLVSDPLPYLQAADISLCPIEHGGGTKIKVWDSLAVGLPTVVFAETLHGTRLVPGEHVLVAEKAEESLVSAIRQVLDDGELAGRLGASGRSFVVARHDWRSLASTLDDALCELVRLRASRDVAR